MKTGMIGLGVMGHPIAARILKAGHELTVHNRTAGKASDLLDAGGSWADTPEMVAERSEIVFTCLSDPAAVRSVVFDQGLAQALAAGSVLVDLSTVNQQTNHDVAEACQDSGAGFLDAPVSGGLAGAQAGTLTAMVGGPDETYQRVLPVISSFCANPVLVGPVGTGTAFKLINQMIMGVSIAALAEVYALGLRLNIDTDTLRSVLNQSSAAGRSIDRALPRFASGDYTGGFRLDLLVKDMLLGAELGHHERSPLALTNLAVQMYEGARGMGLGDLDITSVVNWPLLAASSAGHVAGATS